MKKRERGFILFHGPRSVATAGLFTWEIAVSPRQQGRVACLLWSHEGGIMRHLEWSAASDSACMGAYYDKGDPWAFTEIHDRYKEKLTLKALGSLPRTTGRFQLAEECAATALTNVALTREHGSRWDPEGD